MAARKSLARSNALVLPAERDSRAMLGCQMGPHPLAAVPRPPRQRKLWKYIIWNTEKLQDLAKSIVRVYNSMQSLNYHCKSHLAAIWKVLSRVL